MAVATRIRGMEFMVAWDEKDSRKPLQSGSPAFGLGVMDVDGGIVQLRWAWAARSSLDNRLQILGKPLDDLWMVGGDIGGFRDVSVEIVKFNLSGFPAGLVQRTLVSENDFPRPLQKAEFPVSGLRHDLVTRGSGVAVANQLIVEA